MVGTIKAPAKVNLYLKVNSRLPDGYHNLTMVMQTISLFDTMKIEIQKNCLEMNNTGFIRDISRIIELSNGARIGLSCNLNFVPTDEKNLVVKIIKYVFEKYNINDTILVHLNKMIPTSAGLGGGSSDAAEILLFLNRYYNLNILNEEMINIALSFGADIPFFLYKGTCICENKGEIITQVNAFNNYYVLIATPNIKISTKMVYEKFDELECKDISKSLNMQEKVNKIDNKVDIVNTKFDNLIFAIKNNNIYDMSKNMLNDLEVATENVPEIKIFKEKIKKYGAINSLMSGSGPTVFGIFDSFWKVNYCKYKLKKEYKNAFVFVSKPMYNKVRY